jgi:type VI secretion system secreted protein VgrG
LQSGYRFDLAGYPVESQNGRYVLTSVTHTAHQEAFESGEESDFHYENTFVCIPFSVPFRPPRMALKPVIHGAQTALVVGRKGEEIYTDEHGRVKVQFHWDRDGLFDEESSCWIRVAQPLAGKGWGGVFLPRVGHEVVVSFLEGDPDRPLVTGSVYNAAAQPPYKLPDEKTKSTLKTHSSKGGGGFNEIRFEDKKGEEQLFIHAEKDLELRIKNDRKEWVGRDEHRIVIRDKFDKIDRDAHLAVQRDLIETVTRDHHSKVKGKQSIEVTGVHSFKVTGDVAEQFSSNHSEECTGSHYLKANQIVIEAGSALTLKVGGNFVTINSAGVAIRGTMVNLNSGGAALAGSPGRLNPALDPTAPLEAVTAVAGEMTQLPNRPGRTFMPFEGSVPATLASVVLTPAAPGRFASASDAPAHQPASEENREKKSWIAIRLVDEDDSPVSGEPFKITLPDGSIAEGTLDSEGRARVDHIDPGSCKVTFPNLDMEFWEEA